MIESILDVDEFSGQTCIVTGAARGIGAAIARRLGERGGTVVVVDINEGGAAATAAALVGDGFDATSRVADVSSAADIDRLFADVASNVGTPRVLVNNAGIATIAPSDVLPEEDWDRQIDIMLTGTFLVTRAAARSMLETGGGAIVNLSSIGGFAGHPGRSAYNAAKAGISCLTQVLGVEWAARGIRVNAVGPAVTRTEMLEHVLRTLDGATTFGEYVGRTPLGRLAEPEEIADGVAFLASSKASFITGTTLLIDGGWMLGSGIPGDAAGEAL
jgi:NAD(P)-dependent dehydrogenase (short-subunit alcohol dehydrogenase family)